MGSIDWGVTKHCGGIKIKTHIISNLRNNSSYDPDSGWPMHVILVKIQNRYNIPKSQIAYIFD